MMTLQINGQSYEYRECGGNSETMKHYNLRDGQGGRYHLSYYAKQGGAWVLVQLVKKGRNINSVLVWHSQQSPFN